MFLLVTLPAALAAGNEQSGKMSPTTKKRNRKSTMKKIIIIGIIAILADVCKCQTATVGAYSLVSPEDVALSDTLSRFFNYALTSDSVEFYSMVYDELESYKFLICFKSGYIMSKTDKNALVVICPMDAVCTVKLYAMQNDRWNTIDSISDIDVIPVHFDVIFEDYNFDGQTDLYIRATCSNGYPMSRGHLIIIDPQTKKLELHKEVRELANMTPDKTSKTVKSETWSEADTVGWQLTILTHKWANGQLKTVSKQPNGTETIKNKKSK